MDVHARPLVNINRNLHYGTEYYFPSLLGLILRVHRMIAISSQVHRIHLNQDARLHRVMILLTHTFVDQIKNVGPIHSDG